MTKETYKEDLLPEVIERALVGVESEIPKDKTKIASDILFNFYNRYPHIVAPYLSKQDWLSLREYETRMISEEADDAE